MNFNWFEIESSEKLRLYTNLEPTLIGLTIQNFYLLDIRTNYQQLLSGPSKLNNEAYFLELDQRSELLIKWEVLSNGLSSYSLLETLFLLLTPTPSRSTHNWLIKSISNRFTHILLKPGGVKNMLDYFCHGVDKVNLSYNDLKSLLPIFLNLPGFIKSEEDYLNIIYPQLIKLSTTIPTNSNSNSNSNHNNSNIQLNDKLILITQLSNFIIVKLFENFFNFT